MSQYIEIAEGKTLDTSTQILRISRYHRDFSLYSDHFQPIEKTSDTVLFLLRSFSQSCKNLMTVLDYNQDFIYVKWIEGKPLINVTPENSWMHESSLPFNFTKVVKAVKFLHSTGLAHLDIRAKNIMVTAEGEPVIIDLLSCKHITEEFRIRDQKDLEAVEKELLFSWYERIIY